MIARTWSLPLTGSFSNMDSVRANEEDGAEREEMSGIRKRTDFGLSNVERKTLRTTEAQEAMSDHDDAQNASNENRERLRQARLERESAAGPMIYQASELPDDTPSTISGFLREFVTL